MGLIEGKEVGGESGMPYKPFVAFICDSHCIALCNLIKVAVGQKVPELGFETLLYAMFIFVSHSFQAVIQNLSSL